MQRRSTQLIVTLTIFASAIAGFNRRMLQSPNWVSKDKAKEIMTSCAQSADKYIQRAHSLLYRFSWTEDQTYFKQLLTFAEPCTQNEWRLFQDGDACKTGTWGLKYYAEENSQLDPSHRGSVNQAKDYLNHVIHKLQLVKNGCAKFRNRR